MSWTSRVADEPWAASHPGPAHQILANALDGLTSNRGGAGLFFAVGLTAAVWPASGYVAAFMRAANSIWDVKEGRPVWKTIPLRLGVTVLTLVLLTAAAVAVTITVTGPLAPSVGRLVGVGGRVVTVWDVAKWPVPLLVIGSIVALL